MRNYDGNKSEIVLVLWRCREQKGYVSGRILLDLQVDNRQRLGYRCFCLCLRCTKMCMCVYIFMYVCISNFPCFLKFISSRGTHLEKEKRPLLIEQRKKPGKASVLSNGLPWSTIDATELPHLEARGSSFMILYQLILVPAGFPRGLKVRATS